MNDEKQSFLVEIKFCSKTFYVVWETDDANDLLLKKDGKIRIEFEKKSYGITFSEDIITYDFDIIAEMLKCRFNDLDSEEILSFWNFTQDAADTINYNFIGSKYKYDELYNKLFQNTNAGNIVKEYIAKASVKNEITRQMEAKLYKNKSKLEFTKKDRESFCFIIAQAIEMWSEIFGGITKETAKRQLQSKFGYCAGNVYIPLSDISIKADNFYINRGTIDAYEKQIEEYLSKKFGQVFYFSVNKQAYYPWEKDFLEMSDKIEFDDSRMCETVMFPNDFSFMIYVSHEQTITFVGEIVEDIKKILAPVAHKFNKRILC